MLRNLKGFVAGFLCCVVLIAGTGVVFGDNQYLEVMYNNIKIVIDGKEIHPTDASGGNVEPFIVNGTTYLPVRAVAEAFGKAVQWDGPTYTVYIGDMDGKLEYPTATFEDLNCVDGGVDKTVGTPTDNYETVYGESYSINYSEYLLNMKYSKFRGTIIVPYGTKDKSLARIKFIADGRVIYTSPQIGYDSRPIKFDVDLTGTNNFEISVDGRLTNGNYRYYNPEFADSGFYQ